jgi:hypothetical protein
MVQEFQEQLTQEVEAVEEMVEAQDQMEDQEDQVLLLLEDQVSRISLQRQEQTQLQHYRHQLEVVKLRHSRFLEHLQLANNSST